MRMFTDFVLPKIRKSISYGVNSTEITIDSVINPSLFTRTNILRLCAFTRNFQISRNPTNVELKETDRLVGKRYIIEVSW